ncbi:interleukin-4 [Manis pentadactyla]|uniref:interleukin-4 n=1 Tax=Manis pentadactyla TaxID=143292 RepID=UPI00255CA15F|nr:interleukin-4 [Manis pentadactyla]
MGLTSQLIPTLVCFLAFTSNFIHGHKRDVALLEIIRTLNILTARNDSCMELTIEDTFAAPKNTAEKETFCRAANALRQFYKEHKCWRRLLSRLDRNLSSMANTTFCPMKEAKKSTLKDFLERLKMNMKRKYSKY